MLFNSYEFIFYFLIPVVVVFWVLGYLQISYTFRVDFLIVVSLFFYAQWSIEHLLILLASVMVNYLFARYVVAVGYRRFFLVLIIILNLLPLLYYKYSGLLSMSEHALILPLAISFFTFQQIAFQVDVYRGKVALEGLRNYAFFVLFFPQLVAGPIVHYNALMAQVKTVFWLHYDAPMFHKGLVLFSIGLFKKVVLADSFGVIATQAFDQTQAGLSFYDAWLGLFAYSFQIYFDFSGYADMAIGLALFFGLYLPINFNSPYKSRTLIEFWRRWHITLSAFLKDHIYIPLGGSRAGLSRAMSNLMVTMLIGGVWHGAGWTFLIWGGAHGVFLSLVHLKERMLGSHKLLPRFGGIAFTFIAVTLLWVLFRAENLESALAYYEILFHFESFTCKVCAWGAVSWYDRFSSPEFLLLIGFFSVWFLPNSMQIVHYENRDIRLGLRHAFLGAVLLFLALKMMSDGAPQTFVYFNF